jgi:hypothetical protein
MIKILGLHIIVLKLVIIRTLIKLNRIPKFESIDINILRAILNEDNMSINILYTCVKVCI